MNERISSLEFFPLACLMLYGNFTASKSPLTVGTAAIPTLLLSSAAELALILILCALPSPKGFWALALAALTLPYAAYVFTAAVKDVLYGEYSYIAPAVLGAASLCFTAYLASKGLGALGRVATVLSLSVGFALILLFAAFCKDLRPARLLSGGFHTEAFLEAVTAPLSEVFCLWLMGNFYYVPVKNRAAKPPIPQDLSQKELRLHFKRSFLSAWLLGTAVSVAVTLCCLMLAESELYRQAARPAVFAARLLSVMNVTPIISLGIFFISLIRCAASLSLTAYTAVRLLNKKKAEK